MKKVLITGGANGLGLCLSQYYVEKGFDVTVLDVEKKEATANVRHIQFNLAKIEEAPLKELDRPFDIIICNAGISVSGDFADIPIEKDLGVLDINAIGHIRLIKYLIKNSLIKQEGKIAFVLSASVFFPFPIALAYSASKSALDGFAYALESYLFPKKISISRIYPGPMNTDHKKYYPGAATEGGRLPQQSVRSITRGIERRKRNIYPDPISRIYKLISAFFPHLLCKKAYLFYKDRIG